jgi:hypothetical protein
MVMTPSFTREADIFVTKLATTAYNHIQWVKGGLTVSLGVNSHHTLAHPQEILVLAVFIKGVQCSTL